MSVPTMTRSGKAANRLRQSATHLKRSRRSSRKSITDGSSTQRSVCRFHRADGRGAGSAGRGRQDEVRRRGVERARAGVARARHQRSLQPRPLQDGDGFAGGKPLGRIVAEMDMGVEDRHRRAGGAGRRGQQRRCSRGCEKATAREYGRAPSCWYARIPVTPDRCKASLEAASAIAPFGSVAPGFANPENPVRRCDAKRGGRHDSGERPA